MAAPAPYNTRRKSLSLSELGIAVPKRSRTVSHPAQPSTTPDASAPEPPIKKAKRSHDSASPPATLMSPPRTSTIRLKEEKPKRATELSPPPSPNIEGNNKVDVEGIKDSIVVHTIRQLEKTGNRPHLVKELGAVLATHVQLVERSANPSALISARLTAYLNRTWPTVSPCPLAKDLTPAHPRRLYFYLTTMPRQAFPESFDSINEPARVISPALSSASAADEEERQIRQRVALSPSPEVDLSSPELDEHADQSSRNNSSASSYAHNRRAASPQLEHEERDFKQTANALYEQAQQRRNSQSQQTEKEVADNRQPPSLSRSSSDPTDGFNDNDSIAMSIEGNQDSEESVAAQTSSDVAALFGQSSSNSIIQMEFSSPVIQPISDQNIPVHGMQLSPKQQPIGIMDGIEQRVEALKMRHDHLNPKHSDLQELDLHDTKMELDLGFDAWDALQSPENIEPDELDGMFDAF
ncbi:Hypothetical protein R9X50_00495500 [Acrodontium crateriforme]|uniref:GDS1 winged helix domain-containing protein n=1 Tax=Acrodontium crateriforme TaxID=150365 RepID=A0AAQ3RB63_9PEZI|nr:Hypothetical protein R9X50_00495500 [Acrodontium crateriforme]